MTSEPTSGCDPGILSSIPDDATDIDLHGITLDAAAIQSLARFKSVELLNLASCGLQVVPPEVVSMASLKRLDVSNNPLQYLPAELGLLPHLEEVDVRGTGLQSPYLELQTNPANVAQLLKWLNRPVKPQIRVFMPSRPAECTTVFTVVSYNILAPHCTRRRDLFPLTPAQYLDSAVRIPAIKNEIEGVRGDIFCLQEMEGGLFRDDFQPFMERLGFVGHFCPKARAYGIVDKKRKDLVMGEATFVRKDRFDVVATKVKGTNKVIPLEYVYDLFLDGKVPEMVLKGIDAHHRPLFDGVDAQQVAEDYESFKDALYEDLKNGIEAGEGIVRHIEALGRELGYSHMGDIDWDEV